MTEYPTVFMIALVFNLFHITNPRLNWKGKTVFILGGAVLTTMTYAVATTF